MKLTHIPFTTLFNLAKLCEDKNGFAFIPGELQLMKFASAVIEDYKGLKDFDHIMLERIVDLAKQHGGYNEVDWMPLTGEAIQKAMLFNSGTELFFTRFAACIARELKSQMRIQADQEVQDQLHSQQYPHHMRNGTNDHVNNIVGNVAPGAVVSQVYMGR